MFVDCQDCTLRTKAVFRPLTEDELRFTAAVKRNQTILRAREHIFRAGDNGAHLYTLFDGWAYRYLSLGDGRRQILDFLLPGDLIGLHSPLTGRVRHSVCTATQVSLCVLDGEPFRTAFQMQPELSAAILETLLLEEARSDRRLLLLGRQRGTERLAYLMLELRDRLVSRGIGEADQCIIPLTYEQMADATGLSRAQLGRGLKDLRDWEWFGFNGEVARFSEAEAMARYSGYEPEGATLRAII